MAKLTVIVPLLNKRSLPVDDTANKGNVTGKVKAGFQFDSVEQLKNAAGDWFRDKDGSWYWGGGLSGGTDAITGGDSASIVLDYNIISSLPNEVKSSAGKNITIGIIDTGCFLHEAFKNSEISGKNFTDNNADFEDTSAQSHGTFISGIIAAGKTADNEMAGIAPDSKLIVAKATTQTGITDKNALLKATQWLIKQQPDIINCSFDFSPATDIDTFNNLFKSAEAQNIIWVAAGQDNAGLFNNTVFYPAQVDGFIAVGSIKKNVLSGFAISQINPKIKYIVEAVPFTSTNRFDLYSQGVGSSFASALVTGSLALVKSYLASKKQKSTPGDCINFLDAHIEQITTATQLQNNFSIFKR